MLEIPIIMQGTVSLLRKVRGTPMTCVRRQGVGDWVQFRFWMTPRLPIQATDPGALNANAKYAATPSNANATR